MKLLMAVFMSMAFFLSELKADDFLSEDQRESLVELARAFQKNANGKAMQVRCSTELKINPQVPLNSSPELKKAVGPPSLQRVKYSLVTDGIRFRGSSNTDGKKIDACFDGSRSLMIFADQKIPPSALERLDPPSLASLDPNLVSGAMIAYMRYSERQKALDDLLSQFGDTFVVSFLHMADEIVELKLVGDERTLEAKIDQTPCVYTLQVRGVDGACTQYKLENSTASVLAVVSLRYSAEDKGRLVSSNRTVRVKDQLVVDATTNYEMVEFVEVQPSLFKLEVDASTSVRTVK